MKSTKILSFVLMATSLLATATPAFAAETEHEVGSKDTDATVKIIQKEVDPVNPVDPDDKDKNKPNPDQIANLKFMEAPKTFYFETKMTGDTYSLKADKTTTFDGKKAIEDGAKYQVFSDAKGAHYNVKSVIDKQLVEKTHPEKKVDVSSFKINDKEIINDGIVMSHTMTDGNGANSNFDTTGFATMPVENISIDFTKAAASEQIASGDEYTGAIHNTLYNVYNETIKTPTTPVK